MIWVWAIGLTLLNLVWLLLVVAGLPGTWLIVLTTVGVAWWVGDLPPDKLPGVVMFHWGTLVAITVLAGLGELVEFVAGMFGAKQFGGSNRGAVGALVGTLIGGILGTVLIPLPVAGTLIGACVGAAAGTILVEIRYGMETRAAMSAGVGAGLGRLGGTLGKLALGVVIWIVVAVAAFWP